MSEPSNRPRKSTSSTSRSSGGSSNPAVALNKLLNAPRLSATKFRTKEDVDDGLKKLRRLILLGGIPTSEDSSLRPRIWKLLLRVDGPLAGDTYIQYIARGASPDREKIRNDTFRTLATDMEFKSRVREDMLIRLLDAFVWRNHAFGSMSTNSRPGVVSAPSVQESERGDIRVSLYVHPSIAHLDTTIISLF
ncbi:CDC16 protein [Rhizoctonia solani]